MKRQTKQEPPAWCAKHGIFEAFALELQKFTGTGELPAQADQDMAWGLELQRNRLRSRDLTLRYDIAPRGLFADANAFGKSWKDGHYISRMEYRTCRFGRALHRSGKAVYNRQMNVIFYQIITDVHDHLAARQDSYTCPNCGAISRLAQLQDGCDYCGTRFDMTDLFPKVTGFFFVEDAGRTQAELKGEIRKTMLPCMGLGIMGYFPYFHFGPEASHILVDAIRAVFSGMLLGAIIGYPVWAFRTLGTLFKNAGQSIPMLLNVAGSEKRFVRYMQRYSPEFSFAYFSDKAVSLLKTILFSEDPRDLPMYEGAAVDERLLQIVDCSYMGATALKRFSVENGICRVTADVYMDDLYDTGRRVVRRRDVFRMTLQRDVSEPLDLGFSIHRLQCRSCAASYDATRHRNCPNCGTPYETKNLDWVVTSVRKK